MAPSHIDIIATSDCERWHEVLSQVDTYDLYHLPEYHALAEERGEGTGILFVYRESGGIGAWPFLLRSLQYLPGLEDLGAKLYDATSVYGYAGPVYNTYARNNKEFIRRFGTALHEFAKDTRLVSLFSRMHPLLNNAVEQIGIGTLVPMGETVSIDLLTSEGKQWSGFRKNHRYEIKRAQTKGVRVFLDEDWTTLDEFIRLYHATMKRVAASKEYFYNHYHFIRMRRALGDRLALFVAVYEGSICSASMFFHSDSIIQYHLSGSGQLGRKLAASKLILNEARLWGNAVGAKILHLGGGIGAQADALFLFKTGFSSARHKFFVWRHIVEPKMYETLVQARRTLLAEDSPTLVPTDFFPLYRTDANSRSRRSNRDSVLKFPS